MDVCRQTRGAHIYNDRYRYENPLAICLSNQIKSGVGKADRIQGKLCETSGLQNLRAVKERFVPVGIDFCFKVKKTDRFARTGAIYETVKGNQAISTGLTDRIMEAQSLRTHHDPGKLIV